MHRFQLRLSGGTLRAALLSVVIASAVLATPAGAVGRLADITVIDRD